MGRVMNVVLAPVSTFTATAAEALLPVAHAGAARPLDSPPGTVVGESGVTGGVRRRAYYRPLHTTPLSVEETFAAYEARRPQWGERQPTGVWALEVAAPRWGVRTARAVAAWTHGEVIIVTARSNGDVGIDVVPLEAAARSADGAVRAVARRVR